MASFQQRTRSAFATLVLLTLMLAAPAVAAGPVSVQVNGNTLNLNPAPSERAGRVFVPLRGVFENLGASVVYASGVINATGRGHTVSLRIGSQTATVDGQQQTIDVAPFIIGASTYVPLRFVSQALGATVNYDGTNRIVAISTNGNAPPPPANTPSSGSAISLTDLIPARGASVSSRTPTIEARFAGGNVDPNSIHVYLDDLDVTNDATRSPRGFTYAPRSPLQSGTHRIRVTGADANGGSFNRSWSFSSGTSGGQTSIYNVRPTDGAQVTNQFVVAGRTTPGSHVSVQVGVSGERSTIGGIIGSILSGGQTNSASYSLTADGNGYFTTQVNIGAPSGSSLLMVINATDPQSGATATPVRESLSIR